MECDEQSARERAYAEKLARMIRVRTVQELGNAQSFEDFHALLEELFPAVFERCELKMFGDDGGSLLFCWRSASADEVKRPALLLMSHQDVVDAEGPWTHEPFGGEIAEGRVWGRGALDIKGNLLCILQARSLYAHVELDLGFCSGRTGTAPGIVGQIKVKHI